jgi:hypothetical protein
MGVLNVENQTKKPLQETDTISDDITHTFFSFT